MHNSQCTFCKGQNPKNISLNRTYSDRSVENLYIFYEMFYFKVKKYFPKNYYFFKRYLLKKLVLFFFDLLKGTKLKKVFKKGAIIKQFCIVIEYLVSERTKSSPQRLSN